MLSEIKKDAETRMQKSVDAYRQELTKLRTGRASTAIVEHLKVNYYGSDMPLSQSPTRARSRSPPGKSRWSRRWRRRSWGRTSA